MKEFSYKTRSRYLEEIKSNKSDVLVIGGGIVGASVLRELSLRGIKATLLDKFDFANATSSRSSKLIHGGLRYLEMMDFKLVFEALAERHWLLKSHPHLVTPLQFNLPVFNKENAPQGSRSGFVLSIGLWLYDFLAMGRSPFRHGKHSKADALKIFPGIKNDGLKYSLYYADAMMLDDELVLECIYDAVQRNDSRAISYCNVENVQKNGSEYLLKVTDQITKEEFEIQAGNVISCVGPWTEKISLQIVGGSGKKLKPSKGVHIVLPWSRLPLKHCLVMQSQDGRIIFAMPRLDLGEGAEVLIVGTTDSKEEGDPAQICANKSDVDYLLAELNEYFPKANLTKNDLCTTFAGVRPLIDDGHSEAKTSREHEIWRNEEGVVFMAGGKYTTFRNIAEEIVDFAFPDSKLQISNHTQLSTPEDYKSRFGDRRIWGRFTEDWVKWKLQYHCPLTLDDVVFRRMPMWLHGMRILEERSFEVVSKITADYFQWDSKRIEKETKNIEQKLKNNFNF